MITPIVIIIDRSDTFLEPLVVVESVLVLAAIFKLNIINKYI